ncbi:hypothetical protein LJR225_002756 [Phenylobacterium sp. LjRoot225]|uniref:hypothetical protein n=1 Tax=Phenylobacterium sp. LjRoot225 TaxID=3342285 RepID=UPI003ECEFA18
MRPRRRVRNEFQAPPDGFERRDAKRVQPLPAPPADLSGDTVELVVPVEFFIR